MPKFAETLINCNLRDYSSFCCPELRYVECKEAPSTRYFYNNLLIAKSSRNWWHEKYDMAWTSDFQKAGDKQDCKSVKTCEKLNTLEDISK